mgnify:CR=1 FL=1
MLNKNKSLSLDLTKTKSTRFKVDRNIVIAVIITAIATFALSFIVFINRNNWGSLSTFDTSNYQNLKESLRKIISITDPGDPTVIEISNSSNLKLQNSVLYTQIEDNDLMLVFKDKVVIYRPSSNRIVNIFPVNN